MKNATLFNLKENTKEIGNEGLLVNKMIWQQIKGFVVNSDNVVIASWGVSLDKAQKLANK